MTETTARVGGVETVISLGGDLDLGRLLDGKEFLQLGLTVTEQTTAVILYTGGTTAPKGFMLSHENVNAAIHTVVFNDDPRLKTGHSAFCRSTMSSAKCIS